MRKTPDDRAAFEELYRRTAPWLAVRLRRRCADEQIAAGVMQEAYPAVWRAAGAFVGTAAGGTAVGRFWTIEARRVVDAFRRRARHAEPPPAAALRRLAPELRQVLQTVVLDGPGSPRARVRHQPGVAGVAARPGPARAWRRGRAARTRCTS